MDGLAPPDTTEDPVPAPGGIDTGQPLPPGLLPRRKTPKWPFVLAGFILAVGIGVAIAWPINVPYFALAPGPVNDVTDFISVEDPAEETGDLFFLTVSLKEVNLLEYLAAWLDDEVDLSPRETIRGVSPEELRAQNLSLMDQSKQNAVFVALSQLGYDVTFEGTGSLISGVIEGSAADGKLVVNDVIVGVNGSPVEFSTDAVDLISGFLPGETIVLTINRTNADGTDEELEIPITLGVFRAEDEDGDLIEDEDRGMVGVLLTNAPTNIVFPVEVTIDSQNIGGPSAGLMFTLEIMNQLTDEDLTGGRRIAGTGTIDQDGVVGPIGGVRQKVFGAIDAGAEYVFVPAGNHAEAVDAADDDIVVVRVETVEDALSFLAALPAG
jgi:PDZ domain-containing protein